MKPTRKILIVLLFMKASSLVAGLTPFASAVEDGLSFEVLEPGYHPLRLSESGEGSKNIADWQMIWHLVLRNVSGNTLAVATASKQLRPVPRQPYTTLDKGGVGFSISTDQLRDTKGKLEDFKPKPSDLDIVELKPGEAVILGKVTFVYDPISTGDTIVFRYSVDTDLGKFYNIWTGRVRIEVKQDSLIQLV